MKGIVIKVLALMLIALVALTSCPAPDDGGGSKGASSITPSNTKLEAKVGVAITNITMKKTGSTGLFSITPDLPAGLAIDPKTGTISGTPTAVSAETKYTITLAADDNYEAATATVTITVTEKAASSITPSNTTLEPKVGSAITEITMKKTGSTGLFSITPNLPAGLQIDPKTGTMSSTPTAVSAETEYTITLAADDNYPSAETTITITVDKGTSTLKAHITRLEPTTATKITDITQTKTGATVTFSH